MPRPCTVSDSCFIYTQKVSSLAPAAPIFCACTIPNRHPRQLQGSKFQGECLFFTCTVLFELQTNQQSAPAECVQSVLLSSCCTHLLNLSLQFAETGMMRGRTQKSLRCQSSYQELLRVKAAWDGCLCQSAGDRPSALLQTKQAQESNRGHCRL